jgi:hypothetical protein
MTLHLVNWANSLVSVRSTVGTRGHRRKLPRCPASDRLQAKGRGNGGTRMIPTTKGLVVTQRSVRQNKADVVALAWHRGLGISRRRPNIRCCGVAPTRVVVTLSVTGAPRKTDCSILSLQVEATLLKEDLHHPKINIMYIADRKQDAQVLFSKYMKFGAKVTLFEVPDDRSTRKHLGKLYYFDEYPRFKEIAHSLAKDMRGIEQVLPEYKQLATTPLPNYAIWVVGPNITLRKQNSNKISIPEKKRTPPQQFPKLKAQPARVNQLNEALRTAQPKLRRYRCRHCGSTAIYGTDVCYSCNPE